MNSNIKNIYKNTVIGFIIKVLMIIVSFLNRSIFIKLLGEQYLGIAGLYANIISLLSLADLGIYTASMFSLYKPLNEKNYEKINIIINYFSKIYKVIGILVIIVGGCFTPFLKYLINDITLPSVDLKLYYLLFVLNSGISYFNVCKSMLLRADRNVFIVDIVTSISTLSAYILQIFVLHFIGNYYAYLFIQIFVTILTNILLSIITKKKYPYLGKIEKSKAQLITEEKETIISNIKSVAVIKISGVLMNSTDNILISILLGSVIVGYYSNYNMIITSLSSFIFILINAIIPNIGEIHARGNSGELLTSFKITTFAFNVIAIFITATLISVFNDFIRMWIQDDKYVLSIIDVILISVNFYITCVTHPLWIFTESSGLFTDVKIILFISAVINIIISLILSSFLGLGGIILATGISRILTIFWYEPFILYKKIFKTKILNYWLKNILYIILAIVICTSCYFICSLISTSIINFILKIIICFIITVLFVTVSFWKTAEFSYIINFFKKRRTK